MEQTLQRNQPSTFASDASRANGASRSWAKNVGALGAAVRLQLGDRMRWKLRAASKTAAAIARHRFGAHSVLAFARERRQRPKPILVNATHQALQGSLFRAGRFARMAALLVGLTEHAAQAQPHAGTESPAAVEVSATEVSATEVSATAATPIEGTAAAEGTTTVEGTAAVQGTAVAKPLPPEASLHAGGAQASPARAASGVESSSAPDYEGALGIISDLERIVQSAEAGGWFVDRTAYDEIYPTLLDSVCRATEGARAAALELVAASARREGAPEALFEAAGGYITAEFVRALRAARRLEALKRALAGTAADCPFWIRSEPGFKGRQSDRYRFTLSIETGGNIQLRQTSQKWTFGGGGLGRILPGYGLSEHWSLLAGVEFGGGAMLRPGAPRTEFVINYFPALPLVLRYRALDWHYDIETGPVGIFQADNTRLSFGARIGGAIGVYALRTRSLIPWAGLAGSYEYYFENSDRDAAHFFRGGLRVGALWDP